MELRSIVRVPLLLAATLLFIAGTSHSYELTLTIVYDNYQQVEGTTPGWGFGCFIEGGDNTILFDTGWHGNVLLDNCEFLGVDVGLINTIVISHNHVDHTGGLDEVLVENHDLSVYYGASFPASFGQSIADQGAIPVPVNEPVDLGTGICTTGELTTGSIEEQSLIIDTDDGLLVVTGCSHPGVVETVEAAQDIYGRPVYQICGGFHLLQHSAAEIQQVISELQSLGVEKVGPSHCTGNLAIGLFQDAYGENCISLGVGAVLQANVAEVAVDEVADGTEYQSLSMHSIFPNPCNPQTCISFELARAQHIYAAVFDMLGNKVAVLADAVYPGGTNTIVWGGNGAAGRAMPSGTYIVRLETESGVEARKVSLIR